MLDSAENNVVEKSGPPNLSLHACFVIDNAKKAVEAAYSGVVSCADILASCKELSSRRKCTIKITHYFPTNASFSLSLIIITSFRTQSGGPTWVVPKGRKDGRTSYAGETRQLLAPTFNLSQLQQNFAQRGLNLRDLVALSGKNCTSTAYSADLKSVTHWK
ncbi:hypothetical protein KSS87_019408 [Heliosperma pusillum]|nr:hypothetical protein KSS87_019408 [Heliosperma pusillum]